MTRQQLEDALKEAQRFVNLAERLLHDSETNNRAIGPVSDQRLREYHSSWACGPKNASVKRASLDLTRSLAQMRRYTP